MLHTVNYKRDIGFSLSCFILLMCLFETAFATQITASVERNPVTVNASFKLLFSASESPDDEPDFSPLEKDFEVLNQQKSSRSSWSNGDFTKIVTWNLDVMAKQAGSLTIPVINFGDDQSNAISLKVVASSVKPAMSTNDELYLEVQVSNDEVYVQEQLIYTVRLFQRVSLAQATLTEPQAGPSIIEKLGDDSQYNTQVNGVNYTVVERKYAIFPQQSGLLDISPLTLTAQVVSSVRRNYGSLYGAQQTQTKRIFSKALSVKVLPALKEFKGKYWLAAEQVHLEQGWSNEQLSVTVGEPLTRTITLLAKGLSASQLPEFEWGLDHTDLKLYPDQAVLKNQHNDDGVIAFREQKIALIPSKPGVYTLEAIDIPWFNTKTKQQEMARIAPTTVTVLAKQGVANNKLLASTQEEFVELPEVIASQPAAKADNNWKWLALGLGIGWLLTLLYLLFKTIKSISAKKGAADQEHPAKELIKQLKEACRSTQPKKAKEVLLKWMQLQYGQDNFDRIGELLDKELVEQINELNQCLYGDNEATHWDGSKLAQLVKDQTLNKKGYLKEDDFLEPLNRL